MTWQKAQMLALIWVALFAGPVLCADEPKKKLSDDEARKVASVRLRAIALAFHEHHSVYREFPPAALVRNDGQPLLSWRVLLLPRLGQTNLFNEFKLGEPWDSPHNKKLLVKMPQVYQSAHSETAPQIIHHGKSSAAQEPSSTAKKPPGFETSQTAHRTQSLSSSPLVLYPGQSRKN